MTIFQFYYYAAKLLYERERANTRMAALDVITSRRLQVRLLLEHNATDPCRCSNCAWRRAGARAARITMDRGFCAAVARGEARDRMLMDRPWKFEQARLEKR